MLNKLALSVGMLVAALFCYSSNALALMPEGESFDVESLLGSQSSSPSFEGSETLLSPLPEHTSRGIKTGFPDGRFLLPIGQQKLPPIKMEATINRGITLEEALKTAIYNNLPIKISADTLRSERALFAGSLGRFLPDLSITYRGQDIYQGQRRIAAIDTGNTTLTWAFFQGGKVLYGAAAKYYDWLASKGAYSSVINDTLLDVFKKYNNTLLNQSLLQIRIKAVETSRANLKLTKQQFRSGVGTRYAIMQSEAQLAADAQELVNQEVATRKSAIDLAVSLNENLSNNLLPDDSVIGKSFILDPSLNASRLTTLAMNNRPELRQYRARQLSARASTAVASTSLLPTAQLFVSASNNKFGGLSSQISSNAAASSGVNLATNGTGTSSINVGSVAGESVTLGTSLSWNLSGSGVPDLANTASARYLARRTTNEYNQRVLSVLQEVRNSFLDLQTAEQQIDIANVNVRASREGLRLAYKRLDLGNGTNLELIQSQRTYVDALTTQVKALIAFRNAQGQVLRDTGTITIASLVNEFVGPISVRTSQTY